jgi:type II secretory pathway component PulM
VVQGGAGAVTTGTAGARSAALDAYLVQRGARGFRVETRGGFQAVIVRRHPLHFALRWLAKDRAEQRLVISVDEHGKVAAVPAQHLRW